MIENLRQQIQSVSSVDMKLSIVREYLQLLILRIIEERGYSKHIAFVGGTLLRILYGLNRYSEDLDFSLVQPQDFSFDNMLKSIEKDLRLYGFSVLLTKKDTHIVMNSFIKFQDVLFPLGLSTQKSQILSIKLEIDSRPPSGYQTESTLIQNHFLLNVFHFDKPSLFAGKLHAILCRPYAKGRDLYDLVWFLGQPITPNYYLLSNAYEQTEHERIDFDASVLSQKLTSKIEGLDFSKILPDITPFLINTNEQRFLAKEVILQAIKQSLP